MDNQNNNTKSFPDSGSLSQPAPIPIPPDPVVSPSETTSNRSMPSWPATSEPSFTIPDPIPASAPASNPTDWPPAATPPADSFPGSTPTPASPWSPDPTLSNPTPLPPDESFASPPVIPDSTAADPTPASPPPTPSDTWPTSPQQPTEGIGTIPSAPPPAEPPTPPAPEPTPTFTPPPLAPTPSETTPAVSPLDNPWGAPPQAPPIDQPQPTTTQPSWTGVSAGASPTEAAPTDLSHLISNNQSESVQPPTAENLIAPTVASSAPVVSHSPTPARKGIPKWLIGLGVGLLLLVIGASAYFILGIGQPAKTASLPAETTPKTANVKTPPPIVTPSASPSGQPAVSGSANFGALGGGTQSPSPSSQNSTPSAAEVLRQRQQQGI